MKKVSIISIFVLLLIAGTTLAGDFDNMPYTPGFYLQGYPIYASATKGYDSGGDAASYGGTWSTFGFSLNPVYYGMMGENRWAVGATVPFNSFSPITGESQSGIGDIQLSAAYWVIDDHKQGKYFSVWFWTDLPTGDDAKGLGTGQMNLRPGIAWGWDKNPYLWQTSVYYNLRMKNTMTFPILGEIDYKPGDEIWANTSFGYSANEQWMPGLEIETVWGFDDKVNSVTNTDSKQQWFKVGPSVHYQINPIASFKVAFMYTAMGKNTAQSFDVGARFTWGF